jgi:hypothetical protein
LHARAAVKIAEPVTGPLISRYCGLAKKHNIWLSLGGFQEAASSTHVYNAHIIVNSSGEVGFAFIRGWDKLR